jgi:hypothetical protein
MLHPSKHHRLQDRGTAYHPQHLSDLMYGGFLASFAERHNRHHLCWERNNPGGAGQAIGAGRAACPRGQEHRIEGYAWWNGMRFQFMVSALAPRPAL